MVEKLMTSTLKPLAAKASSILRTMVIVMAPLPSLFTATTFKSLNGTLPCLLVRLNAFAHLLISLAPVDPATSKVEPQDDTRERYEETHFVITLNDSRSNPVFGVTPSVQIEGGDSFGVSVDAGDAENEFKVTYTPDLSGDFPISVSAGDIALANWSVHVNPGKSRFQTVD